MREGSRWRPEHTLVLAILVAGAAVVAATVLVVGGMMRGGRVEDLVPYGMAVAAGGVVAALVIHALGRKFARSQRPDWLETQAWRSGLQAKLAKGQARENPKGDTAAADSPVQPDSEEESGPHRG